MTIKLHNTGSARAADGGSVLMEVVIAIALFFVAGIFVMDGLNSAIRGVNTIKLEADATDLAVTTFSELQMGLTEMTSAGPIGVAHAGGEGWTYEVVVSGLEDMLELPQLKKVEVIVRNEAAGFTLRTSHLVWDNPNPLPAVPGVDQVPSDLASLIPGGDLTTIPGGAPTGAAGGPRGNGGPTADATPRFPQRGNGGNTLNATPPIPGRGNGGNTPNATPPIPGRGNGGNTPNATPPIPGRRNGNAPNATPPIPRGNNGNAPNATPPVPRGNNGNAPDATPRFPARGGNGKGKGQPNPPTPPPPPAPDPDEDEKNQPGGTP